MPSAADLSPEQASRRATMLEVLTGAGWAPDTALFDAGITTDFVAGAQSRRFGVAQRCDYIISSNGDVTEYLNVRWNAGEGEFTLVIDFLGQTSGGPGAGIRQVLDALLLGQSEEADDWIPATVITLGEACPLYTLDERRGLQPVNVAAKSAREAGRSGSGEEPDGDQDGEDAEIVYWDDVQNHLHQELRGSGWRRTPDALLLSGQQEDFYVRNGSIVLSVGRLNGEDTVLQVAEDGQGSARLRVDGLVAAEDTDRLIALLRRWHERITADNWHEMVEELLAAYPKVYAEGEDGWRRISAAEQRREPAAPPPGLYDRTRLVGETLGAAGWVKGPATGDTVLSMRPAAAGGVELRLDHTTGAYDGIAEALVLTVELPAGAPHSLGNPLTAVLDVLDLASGRGGGAGRLPAVLATLTAWQHTVDAASLAHFVHVLQLRCPLFLPRDGQLGTLGYAEPELDDEPRAPLPRPLAELDRLLAQPGGGDADSAALWVERGLAAHEEGRFDLALESFDAAIAREPDNGLAHYRRALTVGLGDVPEAARPRRPAGCRTRLPALRRTAFRGRPGAAPPRHVPPPVRLPHTTGRDPPRPHRPPPGLRPRLVLPRPGGGESRPPRRVRHRGDPRRTPDAPARERLLHPGLRVRAARRTGARRRGHRPGT